MATERHAAATWVAAAAEQHAFLERLTAGLREDARVVAAWVIGSLASGGGDTYSDIDLLVAVRDEDFAAVVADWPLLLDRLTPTVFAQRLGAADKLTITAITPEWQRFDITLASAADSRPHGYQVAPLFTRAADAAPFTFSPTPPRLDWDRLPALTGDFLRVLGLLPVAVGREEFIVGLTPVMLLRSYLIDLYLLDNGAPRTGAKRLNERLTIEQRRALTALPPLAPTRDSVVAGHLALARLFLPCARQLAAEHGVAHPDAFERATLAHLRRTMGCS
jgi:predicted nucleotidyltransferase